MGKRTAQSRLWQTGVAKLVNILPVGLGPGPLPSRYSVMGEYLRNVRGARPAVALISGCAFDLPHRGERLVHTGVQSYGAPVLGGIHGTGEHTVPG